jgi:GNAT superfamily N-acetyltransferase
MMIRDAHEGDLRHLQTMAGAMGVPSGRDDFPRCLAEQAAGRRRILIAFDVGDVPVGYVQLNFTPVYTPFRRLGLAEIQDLNVVPSHRRQGLGARLVAACEDIVRTAGGSEVAISVGVTASFGPAQRLYAALGYRPDGAGICHDDEPVRPGTLLPVDDLLTLKLIRTL